MSRVLDIRADRIVRLVAPISRAFVVAFAVACSSGSSGPQTESGGSAGASGTTNSSGTGGVSGNGGAAQTGGSTQTGGSVATGGPTETGGATQTGGSAPDGGATGTGGAGGTGGTAPPVMDCTQSQDFCISASGVRQGKSFSCYSADATDVSKVLVGMPEWAIHCTVPADELAVNVQFPVQTAGPIVGTATPKQATFQVTVDTFNLAKGAMIGAMTEQSSNLASASLMGSLDTGNMGTGKVTGSWSAPAAMCSSGEPGYPCVDGSLVLTFHVPLH